MDGHWPASFALSTYSAHFSGTSVSKIASTELRTQAPVDVLVGVDREQFSPSVKQSTGHTSTQSVYLHFTHGSVTTGHGTAP